MVSILLCLSITAFLATYGYFVFTDPDALRSEKFNLSKMAIEKNLIGDDRTGLREIVEAKGASVGTALPELENRGEQ